MQLNLIKIEEACCQIKKMQKTLRPCGYKKKGRWPILAVGYKLFKVNYADEGLVWRDACKIKPLARVYVADGITVRARSFSGGL